MGAMSRRKGVAGEREVAAVFRAHGFTCHRTPNSGGLMFKGDVIFPFQNKERVHCEVKRAERLTIPEWWRQTTADAPQGALPVLAFRSNNQPWLAVLPLDELARLLARETA